MGGVCQGREGRGGEGRGGGWGRVEKGCLLFVVCWCVLVVCVLVLVCVVCVCVWCVCVGGVCVFWCVCVCVGGVLVVCVDFPCYSLSHRRKMSVLQDVLEYVLDVNAYLHRIFLNLFEEGVHHASPAPTHPCAVGRMVRFTDLRGASMESQRTVSFEAFKHSGHAQKLGRRGPRSGQRISGMSVHVSQIELLLCGQHGA